MNDLKKKLLKSKTKMALDILNFCITSIDQITIKVLDKKDPLYLGLISYERDVKNFAVVGSRIKGKEYYTYKDITSVLLEVLAGCNIQFENNEIVLTMH